MNILAATSAEHPLAWLGIPETGLLAVLGYALVFAGLIALMAVVILMGKAFTAGQKKTKTPAEAPVEAPAAAPVEAEPVAQSNLAPGTAGQLKIYDVPPKTAAMLMAIVADKMGKPLNELRFISIKEVK